MREILPLILKKKEVKFIAVGKKPLNRNILPAGPNTEFTGYVPDMRPYFERAAVLAAPIRIGSGVRNKILEAMAMGRPVVSTSVGCEGLEVKDGENIFVADKPEEFAEKVILLLGNRSLRNNFIQAGLKLVREKYSWQKSCSKLEEIYNELRGNRTDA